MSISQDNTLKRGAFPSVTHDGYSFPLRVLLYSHDSVGLGHLRRNLAIAGEITATFKNANVMIVTGSPCATQFQLPANTDLIKIPSITKDEKGQYVARDVSRSLKNTLSIRRQMILDSFRLFEPTLIIVDHQLTGLKGEALDMLREARTKGVLTIYGSRDVKDSPEIVKRHWDTEGSRWALDEGYDRICIYGMQEVFDPRIAYAPCLDKVKRLDFTGYLVPKFTQTVKKPAPGKRKKVLVTMGGGGDGAQRVEAYLKVLANPSVHWDSHIVTGPLMDAAVRHRLRHQAKKLQPLGSVKVQQFNRNIPALLRKVDAVVSMAGYNSCTEILQSGVPAVLLPRSFPRREQVIRATRMAELGWMTVLPEEEPDPQQLFEAIELALGSPRRNRSPANLNGLSTLCRIILEEMQTAGLVKNVPQLEQPQRGAM